MLDRSQKSRHANASSFRSRGSDERSSTPTPLSCVPLYSSTEIDRFLAGDALRMIKEFGHLRFNSTKQLRSADALHLAAAVRLGCDYLFSRDGGFPLNHTVEDVRIRTPRVVWQEALFDES